MADFKATTPAVEWEKIAGMRNQLVHEYFRITLKVVWDTVQNSIPDLISELEKIVPTKDDG